MKRALVLSSCLVLLLLPGDLPLGTWLDNLLVDRLPPFGAHGPVTEAIEVAGNDARRRHLDTLALDRAVTDGPLAAWRDAAERALLAPLPIALPYTESVRLDGGVGDASAGVATVFEVELAPPDVLHLRSVIDEGAVGGPLVEVLQRRAGRVARLAAFGPAPLDVRWSPPLAARYLVRVQPALGSVGRAIVSLERRAALDFPVLTDASDPVRSRFGVPRDGGRRQHHGIDIFAPRGTPVLAAADGVVTRVGDSGRGGLHVWQRGRDDTGRALGALYYAHLDSISVRPGTRLARGEPLGTVGNTGNARSTPPHLHFGLYRRGLGPVDPLPLVGERRRVPGVLTTRDVATSRNTADWLAVRPAALNLRAGPGTDTAVLGRLSGGALVRVLAVSGDWARVRTLPHARSPVPEPPSRTRTTDGPPRHGFVALALLGVPSGNAEVLASGCEHTLLAAPASGAPRLALLAGGTTVDVLGPHGAYRRVVTPEGVHGWLRVTDGEEASDAEASVESDTGSGVDIEGGTDEEGDAEVESGADVGIGVGIGADG